MKRLGAVSAAMLDRLEASALERMRQEQIRMEKQWQAPRVRSKNCRGAKHRFCFSINCPCRCHEEVV